MEHNLQELQALRKPQFDAAKRWWTFAVGARLLAVGVSVVSIFVPQFVGLLALTAGILTIAYSLLKWRADVLHGTAEAILRQIEYSDGLGWAITGKEVFDIKMRVPDGIRQNTAVGDNTYYASSTTNSPRRLIENLEESACFTKHQARYMFQIVLTFAVVVFAIAVVTLIVALQRGVAQPISTQIARIVITAIVFVFSAGYIRLAHRYQRFSTQADRIDDRAHALLKATLTEIEAVKLLHDYQILRAKAPLLPSWLWRLRESELNKLWEAHRTAREQDR